MKIHLGKAIARCARCGGAIFRFADEREALKEWPELVCTRCQRPTTYQELILQIGPRALAGLSPAGRRGGAG